VSADAGAARSDARSNRIHHSAERSSAEWWESYFDAHYLLEYEPIFTEARDRREVSRLIDILALPAGSRILDVPCGQGRHAHPLAEAGYRVEGLDYSQHLIDKARARGTSPTLKYTRGDMRKLPARWTGAFDAVLNLFTSFGFFAAAKDDALTMREFARVLKPGGALVWHGGSRDGVMAKFLSRDWWKSDDGTMIGHERSFDPLSGILSIETSWEGPSGRGARLHRIRLYTASRLAELCLDAGLIVEEAYSGFLDRPLTRRSGEMLIIARKRP
jgi:SAM-dependent methyltransferase